MYKKKGVTMLALVIMLAVLTILTTSVVVSGTKARNQAKSIAVLGDIQTLEEKIKENLMLTGELPINTETKNETLEEVIEKASANDQDLLRNEITENKDDKEVFVKIDLEKAGAQTVARGLEKEGINDVFYLAKGSLNVYYLKGVKTSETKSFSTSKKDKIVEVVKVEEELAYKDIEKVLDITKEDKYWNNKIDFNINTEILDSNNLYIRLLNDTNNILYTADITESAKMGIYRLTSGNIADNILSNIRKIQFVLKEGASLIAEKEISINNLDILSPTYVENKTTCKIEEDKLTANVYFTDDKSMADKLIYLNKEKVADVDKEEYLAHILKSGKQIKMQNGSSQNEKVANINNVESATYIAVCLDEALNISEVIEIN